MKMLIVQGPGYYGVNIRLIMDERAVEIGERLLEFTPMSLDGTGPMLAQNEADGTIVILADAPTVESSTGFDTGWWKQGEEMLTALVGH